MGRAKKYGDELSQLGFWCPREYAEFIREESSESGISVNEYLNSIVMSADRNLALELAKDLKNLREAVIEKTKSLDKINGELMAFKKNASSTTNFIISRLNEFPELQDPINAAVLNKRGMFNSLIKTSGADEAFKAATRSAFAEVESELLKNGQVIKKPVLVKAMIKKRFAEGDG